MKVVTFGEIMMRLSPPGYLRFNQSSVLEMSFGGAEANVAVSLALLGDESAFVTRLPRNDLAEAAQQRLRGLGVNTEGILWGGKRLGLYFLENGAGQRASAVTYDRALSAFAEMDPVEFDWSKILSGADWFHFTGITPALSEATAQATLDAVRTARKLGLNVSCDLNYRAKLWSMEKARETLTEILKNVDYLITNGEAAETVFQLKIGGSARFGLDPKREVEIASQMTEQFSFKGVAITLREILSSARHRWSGLYYTQKQAHPGRFYDLDIVDRVGGGDAFAAAFIHAQGQKELPQETIEFALAASSLKHSVSGDFNLVKKAEIEALLADGASARVQR